MEYGMARQKLTIPRKSRYHKTYRTFKYCVFAIGVCIGGFGVILCLTIIGIPLGLGMMAIGALIAYAGDYAGTYLCDSCEEKYHALYSRKNVKCKRCKSNIELYIEK